MPFICCLFLSTPSARRATGLHRKNCRRSAISIHALREEVDFIREAGRKYTVKFLSTPSARRATGSGREVEAEPDNFYPRPPRGGRRHLILLFCHGILFLSTPSARRATAKAEKKSSAFVLLYIFLHKLKRAFGKNADGTAPLLIDSFAFSVRSVPGNTVCLWFAQCRDQKINTLSCAKFGCRPT